RAEVMMLSEEQFAKAWLGSVILLKRNYRMSDEDRPFGFRWFVPEIIKQRSFFRDVALAAFVLYGLGLTTPIFFQLVIGKVLVHQSYATLT
ncbi:peptidase domain-containing ABC transporter, partial [Rhizobium leguminosarum]